MNVADQLEDGDRSHTPDHLELSDVEEDDAQDDHGGDYSARLEELMSDDEEHPSNVNGAEHDEDDEEGFFYSGVDAKPLGTYREQLRDVLGPESDLDDAEEHTVENSLIHDVAEKERFEASMDDEARPVDMLSDRSPPSSASQSGFLSPPRVVLSGAPDMPFKTKKPFLHPTISRLRSVTPQTSRSPSVGSVGTMYSQLGLSAPTSHFSALSPTSSQSNLPEVAAAGANGSATEEREVFRWTQLRNITELMYGKQTQQKAAAILGAPSPGSPTVLAANGLICVGTDFGRVLVFDFKQNLKCVCDPPDKSVGAVTALALSYDHTFVASGHIAGHIVLFDINNSKTPARFVPPTTIEAVASGTQEGHLFGSRIVSIGFVAGRHTAIVSADDAGLAFYHSLGKVLFVEASDTLRILGKYPDEDAQDGFDGHETHHFASHHPFRRRRLRKSHTILAMAPLPLGTTAHSTDAYHLIALLTPLKLVVVGLKPSPKTWYRRHRPDDESTGKSRFKGVLAWFPSVISGSPPPPQTNGKAKSSVVPGTTPMLVYGWGNSLNLVRVSETKVQQEVRNAKSGKISHVEVGRLVFEEVGTWSVGGDVLALQWLNINQVLVLTLTTLEVYDIHTFKLVEHVLFDAWSLVSPILAHTTNGSVSYPDAVTEVAHSVRTYKGKIFLLGQHEVQVGTLLTWADRVLAFVENGDFLSAIELTRSYYVGEAPGNRNGLPDRPEELRDVVGEKMRELMSASANYAFSEDRMTDGTHVTPDGRGVDRTSLFEGLVVTCARACMALDDFEFLFEDLYSYYDQYGITRIFLLQLEPFVLDGKVHFVPPRITQKLVALHDDNNRPDLAERLIWHIDPDCLDINQAITLCQKHQLYDALIYIYTRAMKDYVSPVVELLGLIRRVQQYRRARAEASPTSKGLISEDAIEPVVINAYKIYPYLADVLSGLMYPSERPLPEDEAIQAKNDVYGFVFFGRSSVWPAGEGGQLVLTSDEENGVEPTYPYARLLLRFDAEAFLHCLDLAFEDHYLNDETHGVNRLVIIKILLEILSTPGLPQSDVTFINIFIARNVPKYPQFIQIAPSTLHSILIGLAEDEDESTREDRQLAAEYLLSAYTPHDSEFILHLFEQAGFYRILRTWHRQEKQWAPLLLTYLKDPDLRSPEVFSSIDEVLVVANRFNKGTLPPELVATVTDSLTSLLNRDISNTAALIDKRTPLLHTQVMELLRGHPSRDRYVYLRYLLGSPQSLEDSEYIIYRDRVGPSSQVTPPLRLEYVSLLCDISPSTAIHELEYLPFDFLDWDQTATICEEHEVYDAAVWSLDRKGEPRAALMKTEEYEKKLSTSIAQHLNEHTAEGEQAVSDLLSSLQRLQRTAVAICLAHSKPSAEPNTPLEDVWFQLLSSQISCVHRVSLSCSVQAMGEDSAADSHLKLEQHAMASLRTLVQDTFTSLMSVSSSKAVSFPRLFKRLVDSVTDSRVSKGALYREFQVILTGMLESYRSDEDLLTITKRLLERDVFSSVEEITRDRMRGWTPSRPVCAQCGQRLQDAKKSPRISRRGISTWRAARCIKDWGYIPQDMFYLGKYQ
ncbi:hypothetical protein NM688_g5266 [Phlebia brevispora]|uniref:Uncharacterized protein n=1 Tax=Phlebia brevispora TaxID=194682 RepID=A0ACC1SXY0_9APHY|nr:hypothetical protein NM688_g5266 [Phlebia brevispora]